MLHAIFEISTPQHGVIHRRQLRQLGASSKVVRRMVDDGLLVPIGPSVFRVGGAVPSWRQQLWVAVLEAPAGSVISHRSAARLHGIGRFAEGPIEVTEVGTPTPSIEHLRGGSPTVSPMITEPISPACRSRRSPGPCSISRGSHLIGAGDAASRG